MSKLLAISLIIISFILGIGLGFVVSPQYSMTQYENQQMANLGKADKYVDLRYINAMIAHHKGAMNLASQVLNQSQRSEITDLAKAILEDEPKAIFSLMQWKKDWFNDSSDVAAKAVPNLGTDDSNLDLRFLNALITHHEEGIVMTKEIRIKSTKNEVLDNANAVQDFLSNGVKMLNGWRTSWYPVK